MKVEAIKRTREKTQLGLKEAKEFIDTYWLHAAFLEEKWKIAQEKVSGEDGVRLCIELTIKGQTTILSLKDTRDLRNSLNKHLEAVSQVGDNGRVLDL